MRSRLQGILRSSLVQTTDLLRRASRNTGLTPFSWKIVLSGLFGAIIIRTILTDFDDFPYPGWALYREGTLLTPNQVHNAKAAIIAMLGVGLLFVSFIPSGEGKWRAYADWQVRALFLFATATTGWYWLSSATDGQAWYYLLVFLPSAVLFAGGVAISLVLSALFALDEKQKEEADRSKVGFKTLAVSIVVLALVFLALAALDYVPTWFF